ncbi:MAG: arylesterase [Halieaceae bacterium]|jgi:acyl-CoA thioesterase I|nr:arylesterase [Halieaceae bacterium]
MPLSSVLQVKENRLRFPAADFLAICLLFSTLATACSSDLQQSALPAGATVLAFGDSVTHGNGAGPEEDYPALLAASTQWNVINAGIPGDTARKARQRIQALLVEHRPELVIVELGGNDFLRKRRPADVKEDLRAIVRQTLDFGATTVLVAVPHLSLMRAGIGSLRDADIYAQLAVEEGIPLITDVFSDVLSDEDLRADRIHPNAKGYKVLTEGFIEQLGEVGIYRD